jgi:hypothetical protein
MSQNHFLVGDIDAIGGQGNQWWCAARLLGLPLDRFLAFLVSNFNAVLWDYRDGQLLYYFTDETTADRYCTYINKKAKAAGFYV